MTHNLWVQNNVISKSITSAAFDLGDIGRFQTTSATLGQKSGRWNIGCFSPNIGHFGPNIGRFDSTSAALTSATFDQTSAALTQHRPLSTVPEKTGAQDLIFNFYLGLHPSYMPLYLSLYLQFWLHHNKIRNWGQIKMSIWICHKVFLVDQPLLVKLFRHNIQKWNRLSSQIPKF